MCFRHDTCPCRVMAVEKSLMSTMLSAKSCKIGGMPMYRHNYMKYSWMRSACLGFPSSIVKDEPFIHTSLPDADADPTAAARPETRGDVSIDNFLEIGTTTIFDVRVLDLDCKTHKYRPPDKVLDSAETAKKNKHLGDCLEARRHFTPLVFSVDGLMGKETQKAYVRLAQVISEKTGRANSHVCGFIRSRLSISIMRTLSAGLRRARRRIVTVADREASGCALTGLISYDARWVSRSIQSYIGIRDSSCTV